MKCEVNTNHNLIGNLGSHEFGGSEIFQQTEPAPNMKKGTRRPKCLGKIPRTGISGFRGADDYNGNRWWLP